MWTNDVYNREMNTISQFIVIIFYEIIFTRTKNKKSLLYYLYLCEVHQSSTLRGRVLAIFLRKGISSSKYMTSIRGLVDKMGLSGALIL